MAAGTPEATDYTIPINTTSKRPLGVGWKSRPRAPQSRTAATEPQVPGPGLPNPAPKKVAIVQAHGVFRAVSDGGETVAGLFVILFPALAAYLAKILKNLRIQHR